MTSSLGLSLLKWFSSLISPLKLKGISYQQFYVSSFYALRTVFQENPHPFLLLFIPFSKHVFFPVSAFTTFHQSVIGGEYSILAEELGVDTLSLPNQTLNWTGPEPELILLR